MEGHRTAERRSVAYHRAIAERIARDPAVITAARARVDAWRASGAVHPRYIDGWAEVLALPKARLSERLVETSEQMTALRQVSPFAGVLDARARWKLWRSVA